jgi:hypothetical protein
MEGIPALPILTRELKIFHKFIMFCTLPGDSLLYHNVKFTFEGDLLHEDEAEEDSSVRGCCVALSVA